MNEEQAGGLDSELRLPVLYRLAFLRGDAEGLNRVVSASAGRPGFEDPVLALQSDTEAFYGRLGAARELTRRAVESAIAADEKAAAASWRAEGALREAEFGNQQEAVQQARAAVSMSDDESTAIAAALAMVRGGDSHQGRTLSSKLHARYPADTILNGYWLPSIRAALDLQAGNPARAIDELRIAERFELGIAGSPSIIATLYPVYLRGGAFLAMGNGVEAAKEFQKFVDHRAMVANFPLAALARLGLARGYAVQAKTATGADADAARVRALAAYKDFLTLWKDADPDIPIYQQAKAEYAKLQ